MVRSLSRGQNHRRRLAQCWDHSAGGTYSGRQVSERPHPEGPRRRRRRRRASVPPPTHRLHPCRTPLCPKPTASPRGVSRALHQAAAAAAVAARLTTSIGTPRVASWPAWPSSGARARLSSRLMSGRPMVPVKKGAAAGRGGEGGEGVSAAGERRKGLEPSGGGGGTSGGSGGKPLSGCGGRRACCALAPTKEVVGKAARERERHGGDWGF